MSETEEQASDRGAEIDSIVGVVKAKMVGDGSDPFSIEGSNQASVDEKSSSELFDKAGAIDPPYDPFMLCRLYEHSEGLRPPIDSYCVNIDGFGFQLEPAFNLDSAEDRRILSRSISRGKGPRRINEDVRKAFRIQESLLKGDDDNAEEGTPIPGNDEIRAKFGEEFGRIADEMADERADLMNFFEACCPDMSFVKLRRNTRQDLEITGNGYWEIVRNNGGKLSQFHYLPSFCMRLMPLMDPIPITVPVRQNDLTYKEVKRRKRFRKFVQVIEKSIVYFKEFGDPRIMSAKTGKFYATREALQRAESSEDGVPAIEANEVKHFKLDSPRSAYGVPRWIGALLSVFGSRMANEINFLYFDNKSVPPLAMLVSGGHITKDSVSRIQDYIKNHIKGRANFHKILILEAEPSQGTSQADASRVKIELRPLTSAQQQDALFQKYDERNLDKIGNMFRLPRLLRGDIRDFNRSTAMAALNFTEMQVFQPEREDFDFVMNREIFADLRVRFWGFESRAPVTRDPQAMSTMIKEQSNSGNLIPEEARELLQDVFNRNFNKIDEPWTKLPLQLTLAGVQQGSEPSGKKSKDVPPAKTEGKPEEQLPEETQKAIITGMVKSLLQLRGLTAQAEQDAYDQIVARVLKDANEGEDEIESETITIPKAEWEELVQLAEKSESLSAQTEAGSVQADT